MKVEDLKPKDFPTLTWEAGKLAKQLDQLTAYAMHQAQSAIDWYFYKRQWRRYFCRICRIGAILLTAFTGMLPLINEIFKDQHLLHPLWSAVALALAATLIMLDRVYGFTSGWIRYLLTAQQITQALDAFRLDVERQKLSWGNLEPTPEQAQMLLEQTQTFLKQVNGFVHNETKTWADNFTEAARQLDEQLKLGASPERR